MLHIGTLNVINKCELQLAGWAAGSFTCIAMLFLVLIIQICFKGSICWFDTDAGNDYKGED